MGEMEAINLRAKRRAEEAGQRAEGLRMRYQELAANSGSSPAQVQHARRAAVAARRNAIAARQSLLQRLDRSVALHQLAAQAHDQAAAEALGHPDGLLHIEAAERHRAEAWRNRSAAVQLNRRRQTGRLDLAMNVFSANETVYSDGDEIPG